MNHRILCHYRLGIFALSVLLSLPFSSIGQKKLIPAAENLFAADASEANAGGLAMLEAAVAARNLPALAEACPKFTHSDPTFCASVAGLGRQIPEAQAALLAVERTKQQSAGKVAQMRRNASVTDRPDAFNRGSGANQARAAEQSAQADALEKAANDSVAKAREALDGKWAALGRLIGNIRGADRAVGEKKKVEALMKLINEPEGRADFADKVQKPTYDQTMEFINTKLTQHSWSLRWGARSNKFLMIHPEGAYFLNPATLNPLVKTKEDGRQFTFQIEMDRPDVTMSAIDLKGGEVSGVKIIRIPCNDKIDSEKLSRAFRHLILAAGGKEDPF